MSVCYFAIEADTLRTTRSNEFLVYLRRWRPSTYTIEDIQEVVVDDSVEGLVAKVCMLVGLLSCCEDVYASRLVVKHICLTLAGMQTRRLTVAQL